MREHLDLDELKLEGFFTNGGMQNWTFLDARGLNKGAQPTLYARILGFVVKDGSCPVEHLEIPDNYFDLGKLKYSKQAPEELKKDKRYQGDESLCILYEDHDYVPSDNDSESETGSESETEDTEGSGSENNEWESASEDSLD